MASSIDKRTLADAFVERVRHAQDRRDSRIRAALAACVGFLTLISASATGQAEPTSELNAAQLLLCLLFAAVLAYYLASAYQDTLAIVDDGNRRLRLETDETTVPQLEAPNRSVSMWRRDIDERYLVLMAAIPRGGQSQRDALLFVPLVALMPAAWFTLTSGRSTAENVVIVCLAGLLGSGVARLFLAGCRHWLWVHPRTLECLRDPNPISTRAPVWGWWFYREGARRGPLASRAVNARERMHGQSDPWVQRARS